MDPETARLERIASLRNERNLLQQQLTDAEKTTNRVIKEDPMGKPAAEALNQERKIKVQHIAVSEELQKLEGGAAVADEHLIGKHLTTGKNRQAALDVINENNQSRGYVKEIKIIRPNQAQARALARNSLKSKVGLAAVIAGGTILAHEIYSATAEDKIAESGVQIQNRNGARPQVKNGID